jgi:hypothetical protein
VSGPYHRKANAVTQTEADADMQIRTLKICGTVGRFHAAPTVRAYLGSLPDGELGVQFETDVVPTSIVPPVSFGLVSQVLWREGEQGVTSDGVLACISVTSIWKRYR